MFELNQGEPMKTNYAYVAVLLFLTSGAIACGNGDTFDKTRPLIVVTEPVNGETGVPVNRAILISFDEDLDASSVSVTSFGLEDVEANSVAGSVSIDYDNHVAIFTPTDNLDRSTVYTATVTTGIEDDEGNSLKSDASWTFTTGSSSDNSVPVVTSTEPDDGDGSVSNDDSLSITFSEPMNPATLTTSYVTIIDENSNLVSGSLSYNVATDTLSFDPDDSLDASTIFTGTVTTDAEDLAGNNLANDYTWTFTTGA